MLEENQLLIHMEIKTLKRAVADPSEHIEFVHKKHLTNFIVHARMK